MKYYMIKASFQFEKLYMEVYFTQQFVIFVLDEGVTRITLFVILVLDEDATRITSIFCYFPDEQTELISI